MVSYMTPPSLLRTVRPPGDSNVNIKQKESQGEEGENFPRRHITSQGTEILHF